MSRRATMCAPFADTAQQTWADAGEADGQADAGGQFGATGQFIRPRRDRLAGLRGTGPVRAVAIGLITCVVLAVVGGLAYRLSIPAPARPAAAGAAGASAAVPSPTAPSPTSSASPTASATPPAVDELSAVSWQGAALPVSDVDGPFEFTRTRASGFTQTPQGAALAAVHISTHMDAYTGPRVFTGTIAEQVIGDTRRLLATTGRVYRQAARANRVAAGQPVIAPTGSITSWRIGDYRPHGLNRVQLLVRTPTGESVVYSVPVRWSQGDWKVDLSGASDRTFRTSQADPADTYRRFIPGKQGGAADE
jgi:hypothetical protein